MELKKNIETSKGELKEYLDNIKYIEEKQNDIEELKTKIEKITSNLTGMPNAKGYNIDRANLEENLDKIKEIEEECQIKLKELLVNKFKIENRIEKLNQPYKSIVYLRYIRGSSLNEISEELGYSYDYICKLHGKALKMYIEL